MLKVRFHRDLWGRNAPLLVLPMILWKCNECHLSFMSWSDFWLKENCVHATCICTLESLLTSCNCLDYSCTVFPRKIFQKCFALGYFLGWRVSDWLKVGLELTDSRFLIWCLNHYYWLRGDPDMILLSLVLNNVFFFLIITEADLYLYCYIQGMLQVFSVWYQVYSHLSRQYQ